jgi:hypothetical protein
MTAPQPGDKFQFVMPLAAEADHDNETIQKIARYQAVEMCRTYGLIPTELNETERWTEPAGTVCVRFTGVAAPLLET